MKRRGFTVIELLIVISIIIIVMSMGSIAFNSITGNKSEAAMFNTLSAMLSRARTEAVGVQQLRGVMFYFDPTDGSYKAALVRQVDAPYNVGAGVYPMNYIDVYLDITGDRDVLTLPAGVGVQTIGDYYDPAPPPPQTPSPPPVLDNYIGFDSYNDHNAATRGAPTYVKYGGVILFDGRGQLVRKSYAFQTHRLDSSGTINTYTPMGLLLYGPALQPTTAYDPAHDDIVPVDPTFAPFGRAMYYRSQIGLAVFQLENFENANLGLHGGDRDKLYGDGQVRNHGGNDSAELAEEKWIDDNAAKLMINRYTGSLLRGE